jgi:serine protease Do
VTAWSYVLDTDSIAVVLDDGRRFEGTVLGADPKLEIAVLTIDARDLPHFPLDQAVPLQAGDRVLAFSNLYGVASGNEPTSVLHGSVSAVTHLTARRGTYRTPYRGPIYVLDAMTNNAGAAGGALTNQAGQLAGILGKELRNARNHTWLNYALPIAEIKDAVDDIVAGRSRSATADPSTRKPTQPVTLEQLGVVLVPDVLDKTPPFIDRVRPGSPADKAGLRPDDLILFVNQQKVPSCKSLREELSLIPREDPVPLTVLRDQQLLEIEIE